MKSCFVVLGLLRVDRHTYIHIKADKRVFTFFIFNAPKVHLILSIININTTSHSFKCNLKTLLLEFMRLSLKFEVLVRVTVDYIEMGCGP
jgi:hypothetical protein